MADNYDDYSREELIRELRLRDRRPRFGLVWERKEIEHEKAINDDFVALDFDPDLSSGAAPYQNLIIEGDNFDALRYLRMTHAGKVKCIYIDPPYNTGNRDFIYNDRFVDKEDAYRHSKWLEFMYRRLQLARELLAEDGVIFVSIDDNEVFNLGLLMNQIFGENNFLACIAWEKRYTRSNNAKLFYSLKDWIIVYRASPSVTTIKEARTDEANSRYANPDNDPRGPWKATWYVNPATKEKRRNLVYPIINPNGFEVNHPTHAWKYSKIEHERHKSENRLWWGKNNDSSFPHLKSFLNEAKGMVPVDLWSYQESGTTDDGGNEIKDIFGEVVFDNPKPTKLIERILRIATQPNDIILDFFAGSGTTAHAVQKLNAEDGGNRRFILVSSTEAVAEQGRPKIPPNPPLAKGGDGVTENSPLLEDGVAGTSPPPATSVTESSPPFEKGGQGGFSNKNLCRDVCAERVRRVLQGYTNKKGEAVAGLGGGFAYLRCRRHPAETVFSTIQHEAVWSALCLIHTESLSPYNADGVIQQMAVDALTVVYLPTINEAVPHALTQLLEGSATVLVYSWSPGLLRQHVDDERVSFLPIPQFLVDRFGSRGS